MGIMFKINDAAFKTLIAKKAEEAVKEAATEFQRLCKDAVNKSNTDRKSKKFERTRTDGRKSRTVYANMYNALGGQPPRVRTGHGRDSIAMVLNGAGITTRARVGVRTNARYMAFLETGTQRIKARPWLLATLKKNQQILGRLVEARMKR